MKRSSIVEVIFIMILFTLFVGCAFFITLFEADSYQKIVEQNNTQNSDILPLSYLSMKLKQANNADSVQLIHDDDIDYLLITEEIDDNPYYTYIYVYDNELYELFTSSSILDVMGGTPLMEVNNLQMQYQAGIYVFTVINELFQQETLEVVMR